MPGMKWASIHQQNQLETLRMRQHKSFQRMVIIAAIDRVLLEERCLASWMMEMIDWQSLRRLLLYLRHITLSNWRFVGKMR